MQSFVFRQPEKNVRRHVRERIVSSLREREFVSFAGQLYSKRLEPAMVHLPHAPLTVDVYTQPMNRCEEATRPRMDRTRDTYQAYTLRLSRVADTDVWRATLFCAITGQRWRFAHIDQLNAFLLHAVVEPPCPNPPEAEPSE